MSHVYAMGDATFRRHITHDGTHTLCGLKAGGHGPLALPATCEGCRTQAAKPAASYSVTTYTRIAGDETMQSTWGLAEYRADLKRAERYGATVHHWDGEDRGGKPLHVAWIYAGPEFMAMRVHEVQHVADATQEG